MEGGVVGKRTPTPVSIEQINLKLFILKSLKNIVYRSIYYICFEKKFIYKKELEKIFLNRVTNQIQLLVKNGVLKEIEKTQDFTNILYSQNGYNYYNVEKIKIYSLTSFGKFIISEYKDFIFSNLNKRILEYVETSKNLRNTIQEKKDLRYRILMRKSKSLLTAEDLVFIEEYKK